MPALPVSHQCVTVGQENHEVCGQHATVSRSFLTCAGCSGQPWWLLKTTTCQPHLAVGLGDRWKREQPIQGVECTRRTCSTTNSVEYQTARSTRVSCSSLLLPELSHSQKPIYVPLVSTNTTVFEATKVHKRMWHWLKTSNVHRKAECWIAVICVHWIWQWALRRL